MVTFMKNRISIYKKYVSFSANISAQIDLDPRHRSQRQKVHRQSSLDISRLQDRFPRNFLFTISPRFHPFFRKHLGSINFPISLTLRARSQSRGVISKEQKRGGDWKRKHPRYKDAWASRGELGSAEDRFSVQLSKRCSSESISRGV